MVKLIDWLKFFPFSIDHDSGAKHTEFDGPYFSTPRANRWKFGDSFLYFEAPWSNPVLGINGSGSRVESLKPKSSDVLVTDLKQVYGGNDSPSSDWTKKIFYRNEWLFVGPWFMGLEASLESIGILISAAEGSQLAGKNLFHPRIFESAISSHLDNSFGYDRSGKRPHYRGPLNWRILPLSSSVNAVVCDIHQIHNGSRENPEVGRFVFFPVSPKHFVQVYFDLRSVDVWIDKKTGIETYSDESRSKPVLTLCDNIINSMRLEVGPSTQAEWDEVKETCPDMSITETFGELPWPLFKEKASKKRKETDITPSETPKVLLNK